MNRLLLALSLVVYSGSFAQLTCNPSNIQGAFGAWPTEFGDATVGVPYSQMLDFKAPSNLADIPGVADAIPPNTTGTLVSFGVVDVIGLPSGFTYSCNKPNCDGYVGGDSGCAELIGTAQPGQEGDHIISIKMKGLAEIKFLGQVITTIDTVLTLPVTYSFKINASQAEAGDCAIKIESGATPLCIDSTLQLSSETEGGVWAIVGGTSPYATLSETGLVTGKADGNISVTYGGGTSNCTQEGTYFISIKDCTPDSPPPPPNKDKDTTNAVGELSTHQIVLYPNPANTHVVIHNASEGSAYAICDINGKVLIHETVNTQNATIDISQLKNGIYFVQLFHSTASTQRHKLVVQH